MQIKLTYDEGQIQQLLSQFENACHTYQGIEYAKWDNFMKVISKAKIASEGSGIIVSTHLGCRENG